MNRQLRPGPPAAGLGLVLGRYRVLAKLGQGGMSEVLLASAQSARGVSKLCVIKRLRPDLVPSAEGPALAGVSLAGRAFATMFFEEAQITCRLSHPNIVHTYEVGEENGQLCIVMEYIEGESLQAVCRRLNRLGRPMRPALAARVAAEALGGLHYAHELCDYGGAPLAIVHRDVSPHNVMVGYQGGVKLLDFGIAKAASSEIQTEVGVLKGKVHYMAPEQAQSKKVDRRADVFSAGVVLWELLTARRLVQGETPLACWFSLLNDPFPRPSALAEGVDPRLDAVVMRALERDPDARYPSASAMREALEAYVIASGEAVGLEQVGGFVGELFAETRRERARQIREFLEPAEPDEPLRGPPAETRPTPAAFAAAGPVEGTPSQAAPPLPAVPPAPSGAPPAAPPASPPAAPRRAPFGFAVLVAAVAGAGFYAYGRGGPGRGAVDSAGRAPRLAAGALPEGREFAALAPAPAPSPPAAPPAAAPPAAAPAPVAPPAGPAPARERAEGPRRGGSRPAPRGAPAPRPGEPAGPAAEPAGNGFLTLDTYPWTRVSENGRPLGTTPLVRVPLAPGTHTLTLENAAEGINMTTTVVVKSGEDLSRRLAFQ